MASVLPVLQEAGGWRRVRRKNQSPQVPPVTSGGGSSASPAFLRPWNGGMGIAEPLWGTARQDRPAAGSWQGLQRLKGQERRKVLHGEAPAGVFPKGKGSEGDGGCDGEHSPRPYPGSLTAIPPGFLLSPARSWAGACEIPSPGAVPAAVNPIRCSRGCNIEGGEGMVSSVPSPPQLSTPQNVRAFPGSPADYSPCASLGAMGCPGREHRYPKGCFQLGVEKGAGICLIYTQGPHTKLWVRSDSEFPTVASQSMRARDNGKASITAWQIDCELPGDNTPLPKEQVGWGVWDTMGFGIAALGRERGKAFAVIIIQLLPDVGNVNISMCRLFPGCVEIKHRRLIPGRDNALRPKERLKRERCRIRGTKPFH